MRKPTKRPTFHKGGQIDGHFDENNQLVIDTVTDEHGIVHGTPLPPHKGPRIAVVDNPMSNARDAAIGPGIIVHQEDTP